VQLERKSEKHIGERLYIPIEEGTESKKGSQVGFLFEISFLFYILML